MVNFIQTKLSKKIYPQISHVKILSRSFIQIFLSKMYMTYSTSLYLNNFPMLPVTYTTFICVHKHLQIPLMRCERAWASSAAEVPSLRYCAYNSWPSHILIKRCHRQGRPVQPKAQAAAGWAAGLAGAARLKSELDCHWWSLICSCFFFSFCIILIFFALEE